MRRREFITLLGGAAAAWPFAARAQQPEQTRRVGVLMAYSQDDAEARKYVSVFRDALKGFGWVGGRNLSMIEQWPGPEFATIEQAAKDLIKQEPDVILSSSTPTTAALFRQNRNIPIVFAIVSDPIGSGFVKTFAKPGGNATGFTNLDDTMGGKWLELLKNIVPDVHDAAFLFNPTTASYANFYMPSFVSAGASLGIVAHAAPVTNDEDIGRIVATQAGSPHSGIVVMTDSFTSSHRDVIIRLAAQYRVPAVYPYRFFAQDGGLLAYGNNRIEPFRGAALYVNRILHGEKVSDLPVQAPTQFELVINLKTAKILGINVPPTLLALADEVIE
jgi:putative tryptophan/tyrosine transport system substrate-binding protein